MSLNGKLRYLRQLLVVSVIGTFGCMDINPPVNSTGTHSELLHSISVPFNKVLMAVGDTVALFPIGILVTGDTVELESGSLKFFSSTLQPFVAIDDEGLLIAERSNNSATVVFIEYSHGQVTRRDTVRVYVSDSSYDISHIQIVALDSARGGGGVTLSMKNMLPKYGISLFTTNGDTVPNIEFHDVMSVFTTDFHTSRRRISQNIAVYQSVPGIYQVLSEAVWNMEFGDIYIGIEGHIYGRFVKDSAPFTMLFPAEAGINFNISESEMRIYWEEDIHISSCGYFSIFNIFPFEVEVEFSKSTNEIDCSGVSGENGPFIIPPSGLASRKIALPAGDSVSWQVTRITPDLLGNPARINSTIYVTSAGPEE